MHFFMKALALVVLGAGWAYSATLNIRFEGDLYVEELSSHEPPTPEWTHLLITFEIDEFPTPRYCYPGCHEEDTTEYLAGYSSIPVTATVEKTGGWKGGKTEATGAAFVTYFIGFVGDNGRNGFEIYFGSPSDAYVMLFQPFEQGYDPPEANPRILAMKTMGFGGWVGGLYEYGGIFTETFYEARLNPTVPEPGTMATLGAGFFALVLFRRRFGWSR